MALVILSNSRWREEVTEENVKMSISCKTYVIKETEHKDWRRGTSVIFAPFYSNL